MPIVQAKIVFDSFCENWIQFQQTNRTERATQSMQTGVRCGSRLHFVRDNPISNLWIQRFIQNQTNKTIRRFFSCLYFVNLIKLCCTFSISIASAPVFCVFANMCVYVCVAFLSLSPSPHSMRSEQRTRTHSWIIQQANKLIKCCCSGCTFFSLLLVHFY